MHKKKNDIFKFITQIIHSQKKIGDFSLEKENYWACAGGVIQDNKAKMNVISTIRRIKLALKFSSLQ